MKKYLTIALIVAILAGVGFITVEYYSYIFAKKVSGQIEAVERVTQPTAIIGSNTPPGTLYSFAVGIRDDKGEIHTASSEDRQWAIAQKGQCVDAEFYPYAPWDLGKAGTYYGARLLRLYDCPKK